MTQIPISTSQTDIVQTDLEQLGSDQTGLETVELDISGMTCAACAARIEKKLNRVDGVSAAVNYATAKAHVLVDLSDASWAPEDTEGELIKVVENAGYGAALPDPEAAPVDHAQEIKPKMISAILLALPVMVVSMVPALQFPAWQWVALGLATVVVFWCGAGFHKATLVNLKHGATTMDTLISLGTFSAYLWSLYAMLFGSAGEIGMKHTFHWRLIRSDATANIYFEAACGIIMFILIGRFIEARSKREAGSALTALLEMGAKQVTWYADGVEKVVPIEALQPGDLFVVKPGEKVATDGEVVEGTSAVNNSLITGESVPVEVGPGDQVIGATINTSGRLIVRATAVGQDTELASIARLVEQAQTGKANVQRLADKVSAIFVPVVLMIALVTLVGWLIAGAALAFAIPTAVSVLIIACPCALGLATPTALLAGTGRGAQLGIVIRGVDVLERAHELDTIVFDKTGTITTGQMSVASVESFGPDETEIVAMAAAVEAGSEHPVAKAIIAHAEEGEETSIGSGFSEGSIPSLESEVGAQTEEADSHLETGLPDVAQENRDFEDRPENHLESFEAFPGLGVSGVVVGRKVLVGKAALLEANGIKVPTVQVGPATLVWVAWDGKAQGLISVSDSIKPSAAGALEQLKKRGYRNVMLTGDHQDVAVAVANELAISEVNADVLPGEKLDVISELQSSGAKVAMVGDGVNDAAALTKSDIGISMGAGTDVAIAASDITIMRDDLNLVADSLRLSRATLNTIKSNLFWAFFYNSIAIPVAALGFLNPMLAGFSMSLSSVFVVTNSLRLTRFK